MINTTHNNVHFLNQINGDIPIIGVIDQETINPRDLCHQCYKYGSDFLFGKLGMRGSIDEPYFPEKGNYYQAKSKIISCLRIIMK